MKNELVFTKWNVIYTDTLIISKKTWISHDNILKKIRKLIKELDNLTRQNIRVKFPEIIKEESFINDRNREYKKFILNKPAFSLFMMRLSWPKVFLWQREFNQGFYVMEQTLLQKENASWIESREQWKIARAEESDKIKEFVEYATSQGSKKASYYYKHFTNATYKALEIVWANQPIRDSLDGMWLWFLMIAELKVVQLIDQGMQEWLHYKEIFINCRDWLKEFADTLPKLNKQIT